MDAVQYYQNLEFISLSGLLENAKQAKAVSILSEFRCSKNADLQSFITNPDEAISFEKRGIARTFLYLDIINNKPYLMAYFTIALKILHTNGISKSKIKKLDGVSKERDSIPCYLIAQLGKSSSCKYKIGQNILDDAIDTIKDSFNIVGGRFVILDAINIKKVIDFYTKTPNAFALLEKEDATKTSLKMYLPLV